MKRNLSLTKGVTAIIPVTARNDSGTVLNLTGLTGTAITFKMARDGKSSPVLTLSIGSGIALTTPASGLFTITITAAQLAALEAMRYQHQAFVTLAGVTYRPLWGNADLGEDIA